MKKTLRPILHKDAYTLAIERVLKQYFDEAIFDPLFAILDEAKVPEELARRENAGIDPIRRALDSARIWYADGAFYGTFSGEVARELRALGAKFDAQQLAFLLPTDRLPFDLRTAVVSSIDRSKGVHERVQQFLEAAEVNLKVAVSGIEVDQALSVIRGDLYRQFERSVSGLEFVEVAPDFTPEINAAIAREFTNNLDLYVKNFLAIEIPEMREEVAKNAFAGYRADRLARTIEARYGVTKRKAAFLADQETGLLVSRYRQEKAASIGATTYEWSTSHDERVRPDHKRLDGTIHSFDSPPITNLKTGARNNPGEDFRCRCVAMAIIQVQTDRTNALREFNCARVG